MDMRHNGSTAQSDSAGAYASGGPLILIADASPSSRDTLSADLGRLGHRVSAVESGSAALMMLRSERPALLLLDQNMPGLTGIDLLREMRGSRENAQLPVIIVAHSADAASAVAALNAGADDHILLPCAPPVLAARIERQLDRAREAATLRQAVGALDARLVRRTLEIEELQTRIEALLAEKAALNARLASRDRTPDEATRSSPVKSIAAI